MKTRNTRYYVRYSYYTHIIHRIVFYDKNRVTFFILFRFFIFIPFKCNRNRNKPIVELIHDLPLAGASAAAAASAVTVDYTIVKYAQSFVLFS